jgi:hypothetical protein
VCVCVEGLCVEGLFARLAESIWLGVKQGSLDTIRSGFYSFNEASWAKECCNNAVGLQRFRTGGASAMLR